MTAKEFDKKLYALLHNDELKVSEIVENVKQMRESYAKHLIESVSDEEIEKQRLTTIPITLPPSPVL